MIHPQIYSILNGASETITISIWLITYNIKCNYICLDMTKPLKHKSVKNLTNMD